MSTPSDAPPLAQPKRPHGNSIYTTEKAAEICHLMVTMDPVLKRPLSVREICRRDDMPHRDTVYSWLLKHKDFAEMYGRAQDLRADQMFDDCLDIADDSSNDRMEQTNEDGETEIVPNKEFIARARLRIDTRKWMAGKMNPKKYGDRVINNHVGADDGPVKLEATVTDRDRARSLAAFVAKTRTAKTG